MSQIYQRKYYRGPGVWNHCSRGQIPSTDPVFGGTDINGELMYVGRAIHVGDCIPGKVVPSHGVCYVAYNGREYAHKGYQVLSNPTGSKLVWVSARDGDIPLGAIQGGLQSDGQKLFIGRAFHNESLIIGKVDPGHKKLFVPFDGKEIAINEYEVLVCKELIH